MLNILLETKIKIITFLFNIFLILEGKNYFTILSVVIIITQALFLLEESFIIKNVRSLTRVLDFLLLLSVLILTLNQFYIYHYTTGCTMLYYNLCKISSIINITNNLYVIAYITYGISTLIWFITYLYFIFKNTQNENQIYKSLQFMLYLNLIITLLCAYIFILQEFFKIWSTFLISLIFFIKFFSKNTQHMRKKNKVVILETIFYINLLIFCLVTLLLSYFYVREIYCNIYLLNIYDNLWKLTTSTKFILIYWDHNKKKKFVTKHGIWWFRWVLLIKQFFLRLYRVYMYNFLKKLINIKR